MVRLESRSEAFAAGIAAHLQANVRIRVLPDALAAHDHVVGGSGRGLGEDRGDESGSEGHGGDQGLHVASPLRMLVHQSGCISVRPGGQRLLTVKCHRHLRADVMRITLAAVSSRLPAYWRKLSCYKYIDITYTYISIFIIHFSSDTTPWSQVEAKSELQSQAKSGDEERSALCAQPLIRRPRSTPRALSRAMLRRTGPAAYDACPALARRKRPTTGF